MRTLSLLAALPLLAAPLAAQTSTTKVLPSMAGVEGTTATPAIAGASTGRIQQVVDASEVATKLAVITKLSLRADGYALQKLATQTVKNFKLSMGYTSVTAATMSTTFASNRTGTQTVVWSGDLVLPAQDDRSRPFNIVFTLPTAFTYDPTKGNLLLELEAPGTTSFGPYYFDAHLQSPSVGSWSPFGRTGPWSEAPRIQNTAEWTLKPGGSAAAAVSGIKANYPAVMIWGGSASDWGPVKLPLDLTPFGAPGNDLNVSADLMLPLTLIQSGQTYVGQQSIPIPNDNSLLGAQVYTQALFVDASANKGGIVLSQGLVMQLKTAGYGVQMLQNNDSTAATGFKGTSGEALVVRLDGVFQ